MRGQAHPSLILYKRHTSTCRVHALQLSRDTERFWMDCGCPIWITGRTRDAIVPRQATGCTSLKDAEAVRATLLSREARSLKSETVPAPAVAECINKYLSARTHELGEKTIGQHRLVLGRFQRFCEAHNAQYMCDLTVDLLETFKTEGFPEDLANTSRATQIAKLRCFLRTAYRRDWIKESLVDKLTPHKAVYTQKEPYTEKEIELSLNEALKLNGGTHAYAKHPTTFRLLLELMPETGMRVGDAIRYDPNSLTKGEHLWIYTFVPQKRKRTDRPKPMEAFLSDRLKAAIDQCQWLSPRRPFMYGSFRNESYLANEVYYRMQAIGERCGVEDCRPHRLRDTFAVRKLLQGIQLDDVSRLLGHSSVKIAEAYYAKWVRSRKLRLERLGAESLVNA